MRGRLLADEAALADYEILEMLLFLGIPRRDTKPLAKGLINRFGSLSAALAAATSAPGELGLPTEAALALALVTDSAHQLARPESQERPRLDNWDALIRHLDLGARAGEPPGTSALLLNSRNQLVAEPHWPLAPGKPAPSAAQLARDILRQALDRHASAVLVVRHGDKRPKLTAADRALHLALREAAEPLVVAVHDLVVTGEGRWISLRQSGLS